MDSIYFFVNDASGILEMKLCEISRLSLSNFQIPTFVCFAAAVLITFEFLIVDC